MIGLLPGLLALSTGGGSAQSSNNHVGWGFDARGGFPPIPWHSWAMNSSTGEQTVHQAGIFNCGRDSETASRRELVLICSSNLYGGRPPPLPPSLFPLHRVRACAKEKSRL